MTTNHGHHEDGIDALHRVLTPDGELLGAPSLDDETLVAALRLMKLSRAVDRRGVSLQRQGRLASIAPVTGQEAAVVGSALALDPARDWIVPQYRELPALYRHGYPLFRFFLQRMGNPAGNVIPEDVRVLPIQISLAAQIPHAVGLAWGLRQQGDDGVVIVYFGDGASSEGDFHEACNFAGVLKAPVVFLLQNNGWAISTPRRQQSAACALSDRACGYGFPGVGVDGNDIQAVHEVTSVAVARARAGDGPTLVEAVTYRMGPHNTADDAGRYMAAEVTQEWSTRDPIARVERYLRGRGLWDDERAAAVDAEVSAEVDEAVDRAEGHEAPNPAQIFDHVYAEPPRRVLAQRERLLGGDPAGGAQ